MSLRRGGVIGAWVALLLGAGLGWPGWASAGDLYLPFRMLKQPIEALHREKPETGYDGAVEQLASQIDWLEHYLDAYGTVVAKHPDVWGESRLTRHREEYERQMADQLGAFDVRMNASLRRSDQSFLGMAMALQAAAGAPAENSVAVPTTGYPTVQNMVVPLVQQPDGSVAPSLYGTAPFAPVTSQTGFSVKDRTLGLEPTVELDQRSRYLYHLQELRRINEGDDTADSAGYALNLVRIPVSILPGKKTRTGYGAEITITATPYLSDELLPVTFRNLVINDLVDQLAYPMTRVVNSFDEDVKARLVEIAQHHFYVTTNPHLRTLAARVCRMPEEEAKLTLSSPEVQGKQLLMALLASRMPTPSREEVDQRLQQAVRSAATKSYGPADPRWGTPDAIKPEREQNNAIIRQAIQNVEEEKRREKNAPLDEQDDVIFRQLEFQWLQNEADSPKPPGGSDSMAGRPAQPGGNDEEAKRQAAEKLVREEYTRASQAELLAKSMDGVRNAFSEGLDISVPASRARRARMPVPPTQLLAAYDLTLLAHVAADAYNGLKEHPVNQDRLHLMDVQGFLQEELQAAYEFLAHPAHQHLWEFCGPPLAEAVRRRNVAGIERIRTRFLRAVGVTPDIGGLADGDTTRALAWAILVEASLLNEQLVEDIQKATSLAGCPGCFGPAEGIPFYLPHPPPEAIHAFNEYVRCRWPIRVFALDPVAQQQNVADEFARRRELQVAMSLAFASGQLNAQSLMRFARRLEWDMATIALNQTAIGFSHGGDTFGWRFYPRFQTPPVKGNAAALWESIAGGPTADQDLRTRQIEPGMRECVAIMVMPSFVPYATFDVRTNWFKLTNPKVTELSMRETMELSRAIKRMQTCTAQCIRCAQLYRDGEVDRLLRRVEQLDRELPLQTLRVQIPYENTSGGFEMFNQGISDLAPELVGWYGAPGIVPGKPTTLFLVGDGFSVHGTRVIAGGRVAEFRLLSRQVLEVQIPADVAVVPGKSAEDLAVDVHLATPYGVSSHVLIPVARPAEKALAGATSLAWKQPVTLTLWYKKDGSAVLDYFHASGPELAICGLRQPSLEGKRSVSLLLWDRDDGTYLGTVAVDFAFDARTGEFFLRGDGLATIATSARQALAPYVLYVVGEKKSVPSKIDVAVRGEFAGAGRPTPIDGELTIQLRQAP